MYCILHVFDLKLIDFRICPRLRNRVDYVRLRIFVFSLGLPFMHFVEPTKSTHNVGLCPDLLWQLAWWQNDVALCQTPIGIDGCLSPIAYHLSPIAYHRLPIACGHLPIAYRLLPIAYPPVPSA